MRRRRAAAIGGFARIESAHPDELEAMRKKGGAARGAQLKGNSGWGQMMVAAKRAKHFGQYLTEPKGNRRDAESSRQQI